MVSVAYGQAGICCYLGQSYHIARDKIHPTNLLVNVTLIIEQTWHAGRYLDSRAIQSDLLHCNAKTFYPLSLT